MITLYFSDVDSASHRGPIEGPNVEKAVMAMDATLGTLLDGIDALPDRDRVILLLTSDHGMANTSAAQTVQLGSLVDTSNIRPASAARWPGFTSRAVLKAPAGSAIS